MGTHCIAAVLRGDLDGWAGEWGERSAERVYVYTQLIHCVVLQRVTQHCKATAPRLKDSSAQAGFQTNLIRMLGRQGVEDRTQESMCLRASEMLTEGRLSHHFHQDSEADVVPVLLTHAVSVTRARFWLPKKVRLLFCHCKV